MAPRSFLFTLHSPFLFSLYFLFFFCFGFLRGSVTEAFCGELRTRENVRDFCGETLFSGSQFRIVRFAGFLGAYGADF